MSKDSTDVREMLLKRAMGEELQPKKKRPFAQAARAGAAGLGAAGGAGLGSMLGNLAPAPNGMLDSGAQSKLKLRAILSALGAVGGGVAGGIGGNTMAGSALGLDKSAANPAHEGYPPPAPMSSAGLGSVSKGLGAGPSAIAGGSVGRGIGVGGAVGGSSPLGPAASATSGIGSGIGAMGGLMRAPGAGTNAVKGIGSYC